MRNLARSRRLIKFGKWLYYPDRSVQLSLLKTFSPVPILLTCIVCGCVACCKRASDDPLTRWTAIQEPERNAPILKEAEDSPCVWKVVRQAGTNRIIIQHSTQVSPKQHQLRLQTEAGLLVGTDNGEYGGDLSLAIANGIAPKRLLAANILQLLPSRSGVLVFTGILHLEMDEGAVWLYGRTSNSNNWSMRKIADLEGKPSIISTDNGDILTAGGHGISRLDQALKLENISLPFAQTRPNSISEDIHGRIYVGMNDFVVRLTPGKSGYTHEWFTKPECLP